VTDCVSGQVAMDRWNVHATSLVFQRLVKITSFIKKTKMPKVSFHLMQIIELKEWHEWVIVVHGRL